MSGNVKADETLDLRGVCCPDNYVKTVLKLEEMEEGQILELLLDDGEPIRNVPASLKRDGHSVIHVERCDGGYFRLLVRKEG